MFTLYFICRRPDAQRNPQMSNLKSRCDKLTKRYKSQRCRIRTLREAFLKEKKQVEVLKRKLQDIEINSSSQQSQENEDLLLTRTTLPRIERLVDAKVIIYSNLRKLLL